MTMEGTPSPEVVQLQVPADPSFVSVLRIAGAALAARLDYAIDQIEDLRVMVDEAASLLLTRAAIPSTITCKYILDDGDITLLLNAVPQDRSTISKDGFGWLVLDALADRTDARLTDDGIEIEVFQKRRPPSSDDDNDRGVDHAVPAPNVTDRG